MNLFQSFISRFFLILSINIWFNKRSNQIDSNGNIMNQFDSMIEADKKIMIRSMKLIFDPWFVRVWCKAYLLNCIDKHSETLRVKQWKIQNTVAIQIPVFKWSRVLWLLNGPEFKSWPKYRPTMSGIQVTGWIPDTVVLSSDHDLKTWLFWFSCFWYSAVQHLEHYCSTILIIEKFVWLSGVSLK